jgi:hypothetical protein
MKLQPKVALVVIMTCLLLTAGAVGFALALDNDMKQTAYEIKAAETLLTKANSDWQSMENKMQMMKSNSKADITDGIQIMEMQATVQSDFAQANQHIVNAVMSISKHLNK